jgi:MinD superfamily P-loop ATPase
MIEITILSGKGGTGKTGVAAAFASLVKNAVFTDIDVDAPDLHLILQPDIQETYRFEGSRIASIDTKVCTNCGICKKECRFDAIHYRMGGGLEVNAFTCEGCRLCERICPVRAIHSEPSKNNFWFLSETRFGSMLHAKMGAGEENSGKLVTLVRKEAKERAKKQNADFLINDGPPGVGCSAIASLTGVDHVVLVAEASKSGFHDAVRLIELAQKFKIPISAIINKYDLNVEISRQMEGFFVSQGIQVVGKIPFHTDMVNAIVNRKSIVEHLPKSPIAQTMVKMWDQIKKSVKEIS